MVTPSIAPQIRSVYRRLLRELPSRTATPTSPARPSILTYRSSVQSRIREQIDAPPSDPRGDGAVEHQLALTDQFAQYLRAQRLHTTLLERYNPGMNMAEEDRTRMTARRVGMEMPVEVLKAMIGKGGEGGEEKG